MPVLLFSVVGKARRRIVVIVLGATVVGAMSGCASFVREVSEFQRGWRTAKVEAVGKAFELPPTALTDCRTMASPAQLASSRFVLLTYRVVGGRHQRHIAIVGDQTNIVLGDTVYTNVLLCGAELEVLPSSR